MKSTIRLMLKEVLAFIYCLYGGLKKFIGDKKSPRLRVLLYHNVPMNSIPVFERQIKYIQKKWNFISPKDFKNFLEGDLTLSADSVLLTFDDGFKSNRWIAESVLEKYQIKAIFFVVTKFIEISDKEEARRFVSDHIIPDAPRDEKLDQYNMDIADLQYLRDKGHEIGSHTMTHAKLTHDLAFEKIELELNGSKQFLEERLNLSVQHFAYTFGNIESFSDVALGVATKSYDFIHTGLRGINCKGENSKFCIRRDPIDLRESHRLINFYLAGGADIWYKESLRTFAQWLGSLRANN